MYPVHWPYSYMMQVHAAYVSNFTKLKNTISDCVFSSHMLVYRLSYSLPECVTVLAVCSCEQDVLVRLPYITFHAKLTLEKNQPIMLIAPTREGNVPSIGLLQSADSIVLITAH